MQDMGAGLLASLSCLKYAHCHQAISEQAAQAEPPLWAVATNARSFGLHFSPLACLHRLVALARALLMLQ